MSLCADVVGVEFEARQVEITPRMMLAYAAGIGDTNPRTFDDADEERFVASPFLSAALEWPVVSRGRLDHFDLPPGEARRIVHVEHDSLFHRPIRSGDRLRTSGRVVAGRATSAGAFVRTRLATVDAADGNAVTTTWHGALYRGISWIGPSAEVEAAPPAPTLDARPAGETTTTIATAPNSAHVYTECSGIWNPIHTERRAALAAGLPGVILHGSAIWALAGSELIRVCAGGDPTRIRRLRARFSAMVMPGEMLTLCAAERVDGVHFVVTNAAGRLVVTAGFAAFAAGCASGGLD